MSKGPGRQRVLSVLRERLDELSSRSLILFGGKGGVGKTTMSLLAALHLGRSHAVTLITTDPAGNLTDFEGSLPSSITIETIDATGLWASFLEENLGSFLELGDRGTYLDRDELRRFFELSIPGVDELMGWSRIAEVVRTDSDRIVIVDTAPTGHTMRLLSSSSHWRAMETVFESMQEKHREIVTQLTRTSSRDEIDEFLATFSQEIESSEQLFRDPSRTAFIPVMTAEPWVVEQTNRFAEALHDLGLASPYAILNHAATGCSCSDCDDRRRRETDAAERSSLELVRAPRACGLFRTTDDLRTYLSGKLLEKKPISRDTGTSASFRRLELPRQRLVFIAGKGGVGKTTISSALALRAATSGEPVTLLSVDPAHSVDDVFRDLERPDPLTVETIDTKRWWKKLETEVGESLSTAIEGLTPRGFRNVHDDAIARQLLEIAPPGADEIFALIRILELRENPSISHIFVDTAPTGHFLRLLALPEVAGDWVRELMRIILRYREILSSSSLGEKLLDASRSLREFEKLITGEDCAVVVVSRPEPVVIAETRRLLASLRGRGLNIADTVVNSVAPDDDCRCHARLRDQQFAEIETLRETDAVLIPRRSPPPTTRDDLLQLVAPPRE